MGFSLKFALLVTLFCCGSSSAVVADGLSVSYWALSTGVGPVGDGVGGFIDVVANPFSETQYFEYGPFPGPFAYTAYDFAWSDTEGDFLIQGSHHAEDSSSGFFRSISNGDIIFTSTQPLLFTVDAEYSYRLPSSSFSAAFVVAVVEVGTHEEFMAHSFLETFPGAGTFEVHDQVLLPAGREYLFLYRMNIDAFDNTGAIGAGDGFVHFTLESVPEPTTLGLALLGSALLLRRRSR